MMMNVDFVICECCRLSEECTPSYIHTIRQRYGGKWICGLCAEAVKYEALRCQNLISPDEALARHLSFCSNPPQDPDHPNLTFIRAITHLLKKTLDSPKLPSSHTGTQHSLLLRQLYSEFNPCRRCSPRLLWDTRTLRVKFFQEMERLLNYNYDDEILVNCKLLVIVEWK